MLQKVKLNYGTVAVYCIMIFLCLKHTCVLIPFASSEASASELQQLLSCRQVSWPIGWVDFDLFRRFFTNWQWGWSFVKIKKGIKRKTIRRTCHTKNLISIEKFNQPNIVLILYGTQKMWEQYVTYCPHGLFWGYQYATVCGQYSSVLQTWASSGPQGATISSSSSQNCSGLF